MFIVVEGGEACGKTTASKALAEWLKAEWRCFPDRTTPIGKLIDLHLRKKWAAKRLREGGLGDMEESTIDALAFQALQLANRAEVVPAILTTLRNGRHVVCDRYWGSGYAYGAADGLDRVYLLQIHMLLPEPALSILIDVSTEVAIKRLKARGGIPERYEENAEFMARVAGNYRELWATRMRDPRWVVVDGNGTKEQTLEKLKALIPAEQQP